MADQGSNPFGKPLFGATATGASATSGAPSASTATTSLFGGGAPKTGLFGGAASTPNPFGAATNNASASGRSGGLFGAVSSSGGAGGFSFGKPAGTENKPTGGLFANLGQPKSSEDAASSGLATPAPAKSFTLFSTTPAGPPPAANSAQPATGLFGTKAPAPSNTGLFGAKPAGQQAADAAPSGESQPGQTSSLFGGAKTGTQGGTVLFPQTSQAPFGGGASVGQSSSSPFASMSGSAGGAQSTPGLFGSKAGAPNDTPAQSSGGLFGAKKAPEETTGQQSTSALFGNTKPADSTPAGQSASNPFGNAKPAEQKATAGGLFGAVTSAAQPASTTAAAAPTLFAGLGSSAPSQTSAAPTSTLFGGLSTGASSASQPSSTSLFGAKGAPATTTAPTTTSAAPAQSLFGGLGAATTQSAQPASTTAPSASSLFGSAKPAGTTEAASNPTATKSMFGTAPTASAATTQAGATTENKTATTGITSANLGASTVGPAAQHSRLKNKTMDEIITRWASDLSKYQKEFSAQAQKVAEWDRLLVDNGAKIQQLYSSTYEAERANAEIERQITTVESQQDELAAWLDRYEAEIDEMQSRQVGSGDIMSGPDQERERTYKLAERLTEKLDEMGKDLGNMIEGMNEASSLLNKTNKADDPVLNSQLRQLQWIDQNTKSLQEKVDAASRMGQSMGASGYANGHSELSESFRRSYLNRR